MHFVSERRDHRLIAMGSALIALAFVAVLAFAARAQAAETIYWDNYSADPDTVGFADITGSGGGLLNLSGVEIEGPEGMAYDSATNRMFVASDSGGGSAGQIVAINLDGGGASVFTAPGAVVDTPEGIALDPVTRTLYWINTTGTGSIGWAKLDGSAGGLLNTTGATLDNPYRGIAVDPSSGKVYWSNSGPEPEVISFANGNNSGGGGSLDLTGAPAPVEITGLVTDHAGGRLYWLDNEGEDIGYASLGGGNGGEVALSGAPFNDPYGFAFDQSLGRFYWGNYGNGEERSNAIGFANLAGGGGGITPATTQANGLQDPVILKSPSGTGVPVIARDPSNPAVLTCSAGTWAPDFAGSFVYQTPRTIGYQWTLNGAAIAGATSGTLTATTPGAYACTVTATNQAGSASQTSGAAATVNAASVKLTAKPKKAKAKAGKAASFKVQALNQGDLPTGNAKVCVKVPKKAKKALKAPKCKTLGAVGALTTRTAKLKVKVKPTAAKGSYKVTLQIKGSAGKAVKATVKVIG
jgi:hypothetical protein